MEISDEAIRERAYQIWEREGRPHGRDFEHWVRAQVELIAETSDGNGARKAALPAASTAPRARAATAKATKPVPATPAKQSRSATRTAPARASRGKKSV